jgi:UTP:GlnB (protein PII) uridylyltransferase
MPELITQGKTNGHGHPMAGVIDQSRPGDKPMVQQSNIITGYKWEGELLRLSVRCGRNELGFLERFAAVTWALNWSIVNGTVDTTGKKVEDVFYLSPPKKQASASPESAIMEISMIVETVLSERLSVEEIFSRYDLKPRKSRTKKKADIDIVDLREKKLTAIFVETKDRQGLLFNICRVLSANDIDIRRGNIRTISNKGRVEDVFYTLTSSGDLYGSTALAVKVHDEIMKSI